MASLAMPTQAQNSSSPQEEQVVDTRTPSPLPKAADSHGTSEGGHQPELSQEVAMLSTKLINAINFQTTLDDQLQQTKHELEMSQRQFERLQAEKKYLDNMIQEKLLLRKSDVDPVIESLRAELAAERHAREAAEKVRKQTEAELENLTSALFEEANEMVAAARKDTEAAEKRNSQLKSQLGDTEVLLASQQEQLQDLKLTMEKMSERGDNDTARDSVPSTPIHPPAGLFDGLPMSPSPAANQELPPEHPLFFSQLLSPVLRNDVAAFQDFQELLQAARKAVGHYRSSSSGTGTGTGTPNAATPLGQAHYSGSSPNLPGAFSFSGSSPHNSGTFSTPIVPLKDTRFYKRTLMEDIEPTLRLDQAPGLSFLSRRSVLSALLQGSLVVEPFMPGSKFYGPVYSCALCGEGRKTEPYIRKHRFRTSEEESAQRYPLCDFCLGRIRASGDFMTFLRMVRDGHWRADSEGEQKSAWEESVRLRERMFWARIGGGVVPNVSQRNITPPATSNKSARNSIEAPVVPQKDNVRSPVQEDKESKDQTQTEPRRVSLDQKLVEVFKRHRKSMSLGNVMMDFSPTGERLMRSPTLESIKQESARSEKIGEPSTQKESWAINLSGNESRTVANTSKTETPDTSLNAKEAEAQQPSKSTTDLAPANAADEGSQQRSTSSREVNAIPSSPSAGPHTTDDVVSEQAAPGVRSTPHDQTNAAQSSDAEPIHDSLRPTTLVSAKPITISFPQPRRSAAESTTEEAPIATATSPDIQPITDVAKAAPSTDDVEAPSTTTATTSEDAIPVTASTEVAPSPAEKTASRTQTPPTAAKTIPVRPGGTAVRKKSSNTSITSNSGTSSRPSLATAKRPSSESTANRNTAEKRQGGGVLARVRAMESQASAKPAGGKTT